MSPYDQASLEELSARTLSALDAAAAKAEQLALVEVEGGSPDRRVVVVTTPAGTLLRLRLLDNVLRRYDTAALGDLVTRVVRDTQRKAREAYQREVAELEPPEVAECARVLAEIWRD